MNRVEQIFESSKDPATFAVGYLSHLSGLLKQIDVKSIADFTNQLLAARDRGSRIFFIGNGGSAATASHFANDIAIGTRSWQKPFRVLALTDNVPVITAIANDYSYEEIFTLQLKTQMTKDDVVVAISASGNSQNLVKALEYANQHGAVTVALTGFDGGKIKKIAKFSVHAQTESGEYGPVEDIHMILDHLIGGYLMLLCRKEEGQGL